MLKINLKGGQDVWFTSDLHLGHKNIVYGVSNWENKSGCRDFRSIGEHDFRLIDNINRVVKEKDILFHLGDFYFGGREDVTKYRDLIKCKNVHTILGNHDHNIESPQSRYRVLFSSVDYYKEIKIIDGDVRHHIVMCHYPMVVWNGHHKGSIMLHGHSHGSLPKSNRKIIDVGVDTNWLKPYSLDSILRIANERSIDFIDHHNSSTG